MFDEAQKETLRAEINRILDESVGALMDAGHLESGSVIVLGCSTSEITGARIGKGSVPELGEIVAEAMLAACKGHGVHAAFQCCEHLNRALIVEHEAVPNAEIVNVLPQPKAGSSFATAAYESFRHPVALEEIRADAGLDIGGTLIGMHLKKVAVPVRLKQDHIGQAIVLAARVRPKFIGGERAIYNEELKNGYPDFDAE